MGVDAVSVLRALSRLAPDVLELVGEIVDAIQGSRNKRDAARRVVILAAKKALTG